MSTQFFLSELPCLVIPSLTPQCFLDLTDVTLACKVSRNLSLPYQLLSILTAMLLILDKTKAKLLILDKKAMLLILDKTKAMLLMPVENNALQLMQAWTATAAV